MTEAWDDDVDSEYPGVDPRYLPMDPADLGGSPRRYTVNGQDVTDTVAYFLDTDRDWEVRQDQARHAALAQAHLHTLLHGGSVVRMVSHGPGQRLRELTAWARAGQITLAPDPTPAEPQAAQAAWFQRPAGGFQFTVDNDEPIGDFDLGQASASFTVTLHDPAALQATADELKRRLPGAPHTPTISELIAQAELRLGDDGR